MFLSVFALSAGAASGAPPLWPHPMRDGQNGAPGVYANYDFSKADASPDMEVDHVWTTIPLGSETDGNGVFASSQFWHEAAAKGYNAAGYMGSQAMRRSDGSERRVFVFSCWDANKELRVSWSEGSPNCARFGGEGVGSHCLLELPIEQGVLYNFRLAMSGSNATHAHWTGAVTNTVSGEKHVVGTLVYPNVENLVGFGNLHVHSDDFLEYFLGGDCTGAVKSGVGIFGPYFHNKTMPPAQAYPSYSGGADACSNSVVDYCIPGRGCHKPGVHLAGGKGVVRDTTNGEPLWKDELLVV